MVAVLAELPVGDPAREALELVALVLHIREAPEDLALVDPFAPRKMQHHFEIRARIAEAVDRGNRRNDDGVRSLEQEANTPGRPLYKSYAVYPYPRLWGQHVEYVSGHSWVVPARERTPRQREAIARFFRFMAAHNYDWTRTGHIPAFKAVLDDPRFKALPHRADIAPLASMGRPLPGYVLRQNAIEGIVGEEAAAAFTGQKSVPQALAAAGPEILLLSTEPYPFSAKNFDELKEICPQAAMRLVDGELFSWYGSRLLLSPGYFAAIPAQNGGPR